jgi:UDP-3-O-[3-hydroxymyristoyl] glucosamine N-acyltransferase
VISDGCVIGDEVIVGANTVLEPKVKVGRGTHIHPLVFIGHSCEIGAECEIKPNTTIGGEGFGFAHDEKGRHYRITHYGRVIIEDRVDIGAGVQIDRGTFDDSHIGEGTKIDNHSHFGHNIRIGEHSILVAGALVAGSVSIGSHCIIGGRTNIGGHLQITDGVQLMATSSVAKSIDKPGQYGGLPIQDAQDAMKTRAVQPLLPKLRKQVNRILKKLEMEE